MRKLLESSWTGKANPRDLNASHLRTPHDAQWLLRSDTILEAQELAPEAAAEIGKIFKVLPILNHQANGLQLPDLATKPFVGNLARSQYSAKHSPDLPSFLTFS